MLFASEGTTALEVAEAARPEVIPLDIQIPGPTGFEVCRRLKAGEATREVPVIFITAHEDTASLTEAFRVGAVDFVAKSFRREEVLADVETHLKINRLRRSLAEKNRALEISLFQRFGSSFGFSASTAKLTIGRLAVEITRRWLRLRRRRSCASGERNIRHSMRAAASSRTPSSHSRDFSMSDIISLRSSSLECCRSSAADKGGQDALNLNGIPKMGAFHPRPR